MTIENYLAIAAGLVAVVCGRLMVGHRVKVFGFSSGAQRALGGAVGRRSVVGSRRCGSLCSSALVLSSSLRLRSAQHGRVRPNAQT